MAAAMLLTVLCLMATLCVEYADGFIIPAGGRPSRLGSGYRRYNLLDPNTLASEGMGFKESLQLLASLANPTVKDYNSVIAAAARERNGEACCWLIEEMNEQFLPPNAMSYELAIEACGANGMVDEARYLLGIMKDEDMNVEDIYMHVARACEVAQNWRQLMWTFDEMELREIKPQLKSYNRAIGGCSDEGEWEMAYSLVMEAERRGVTLDDSSFATAVRAASRANQATKAHELIEAMRGCGLTPGMDLMEMVIGVCEAAAEAELVKALQRETILRGS